MLPDATALHEVKPDLADRGRGRVDSARKRGITAAKTAEFIFMKHQGFRIFLCENERGTDSRADISGNRRSRKGIKP